MLKDTAPQILRELWFLLLGPRALRSKCGLWTGPSDYMEERSARNVNMNIHPDRWNEYHLIKGANFVSAIYTIWKVHLLPQIISISKKLFRQMLLNPCFN